jgi:hypothetical protein
MEPETNFFKINQQCLQNIVEIRDALSSIETKGESTMIMYRIRLSIMATLEQIQKDNSNEEPLQQSQQPQNKGG